jgi:hypothetical protein
MKCRSQPERYIQTTAQKSTFPKSTRPNPDRVSRSLSTSSLHQLGAVQWLGLHSARHPANVTASPMVDTPGSKKPKKKTKNVQAGDPHSENTDEMMINDERTPIGKYERQLKGIIYTVQEVYESECSVGFSWCLRYSVLVTGASCIVYSTVLGGSPLRPEESKCTGCSVFSKWG